MLFILMLFAVFIISALFIVLFGARIYKRIVADSDINYDSRTSIAYISEKIRQHDKEGAIEVIYYDDSPVLRLLETYSDRKYYTYLYEHEGAIKELTCPAEYDPVYSAGQEILKVTSFDILQEAPGLFRFEITDVKENRISFFVSQQSHTEPLEEAEEETG